MASSKKTEILRERNRLISQYREEIEGLREINDILTAFIYLLICDKGEIEISRSAVSEGIGKYECAVESRGENYWLRISRRASENISAEDVDEGDEI